jgi:hypothetical protein
VKAFDLTGKEAGDQRSYIIDNTLPPAPDNVAAVGSAGTVTLSWDPVLTDAVVTYKIYMGTNAENLTYYKTVNSAVTAVIEMDTTEARFFGVSAVDRAGNEGPQCEPISASAVDDTQTPVMTALSPSDDRRTNSNTVYFSLSGQDNYKIKEFILEYKAEAAETYQQAAVIAAPAHLAAGAVQSAYYAWDTTGFEGRYQLRAKAVDYGGNESAYLSGSLVFDKTAPAKPANVQAEVISGGISLCGGLQP